MQRTKDEGHERGVKGNALQNDELKELLKEVSIVKENTATHLGRFFSQATVDALTSCINSGEQETSSMVSRLLQWH